MRQRIIARFADGELLKGVTEDLSPAKEWFHLELADSGARRKIALDELKAVFFVRSFDGDRRHQELREGVRPGCGQRVRVVFQDGEEIDGYTSGLTPGAASFFVLPLDPESNNERILVVTGATAQIELA